MAFGRAHVSPVCRDLVSAHPKISIDLRLTDRMVDLIEEGVDVVVRIGPPKDSRLVMRKLIDDYRIVVGAPEYLEHRGTPMTPADLEGHDCVHYRGVGTHWRLVGAGGQAIEVPAVSRLRSNSGQIALDWALAGCGLIMNSSVDVAPDRARAASCMFSPVGAATPRLCARSIRRAASFRAVCGCLSTPWRSGSTSALPAMSRHYNKARKFCMMVAGSRRRAVRRPKCAR